MSKIYFNYVTWRISYMTYMGSGAHCMSVSNGFIDLRLTHGVNCPSRNGYWINQDDLETIASYIKANVIAVKDGVSVSVTSWNEFLGDGSAHVLNLEKGEEA